MSSDCGTRVGGEKSDVNTTTQPIHLTIIPTITPRSQMSLGDHRTNFEKLSHATAGCLKCSHFSFIPSAADLHPDDSPGYSERFSEYTVPVRRLHAITNALSNFITQSRPEGNHEWGSVRYNQERYTKIMKEKLTTFLNKDPTYRYSVVARGTIVPGDRWFPSQDELQGEGISSPSFITRLASQVIVQLGLIVSQETCGESQSQIDFWDKVDDHVTRWISRMEAGIPGDLGDDDGDDASAADLN